MYIFSKLSFAAFVIVVAAFVAEKLGMLDMRYVIMVANIAAVIQVILLLVVSTIEVKKYRKKRGIRMVRYQVTNKLVNGGTFIIPKHVSPTDPRKSALFEVFLEVEDVEEIPNISVNKTSATHIKQDMKDNIISVKSGIVNDNFVFTAGIIVRPDEMINFMIEKDTTVKLFVLGELYIP
jgi:hypothetical protein